MAAKRRVIVAGAAGVFGRLLVAELAKDFDVVPATRAELDLRDPGAVAKVARGAYAFACAAGPFQMLDRRIVRAVVEEGTHWLDISDDAAWFFGLLDDPTLDAAAKERGVAVIPGLSTLPAISGALARRVIAPHVDITLFIGNRNRKGVAAIASAAMSGGTLDSPDRELLRRELGIDATARVKLELPGARLLMRIASPRLLAWIGGAFSFFGTRGGYVEARAGEKRARLTGRDQRMAILPLVFALQQALPPGAHAPSIFDSEELLSWLEERV